MKKILFLCCTFFVGITASIAQTVILTENFESGVPGTWTVANNPGSFGWQSGTNTSLSSQYFTIPAPASGTGIVAVNDDVCGDLCPPANDWLTSYDFDVSGYDSVRIYFDVFIKHYEASEDALVVYNFDGNPANYSGAALPSTPAAAGWRRFFLTVDDPSELTSTFHIGFAYIDGNVWGGGIAVDNVEVIGYSGPIAGPPNDDCSGAVSLLSSSTCTPVSGTIIGATASGLPQACTGGTPSTDVWYSFEATSEIATISAQSTVATQANGFDLVLELYEGTCSGLSFLSCADGDDITGPGATGQENINIEGLTIGNVYYVRVYNYFGTSAVNGTFSICVEERPSCSLTQPAGAIVENETCGGTANNTCATGMNISCGDTIWGTYSANGGTRDLDYYKFTLTNPAEVNLTIETEFPGLIILYDAADCASTVFLNGSYFDGCDQFTLTHNITTAGTYAVAVIPDGFFSPGCAGNNTNYILSYTINTTSPTLTAGGVTTFCSGEDVVLTTTGTGTIEWYNGATLILGETGASYTATTSGSYTSVVTDGNGCPTTSNSIVVTVNPSDDASFNYTPFTICQGGGTTVFPASVTTLGGTFSSSIGLIFEDASTGEINVDGSTIGTYTVTYTTSGTCPGIATQDIEIITSPDASFTYAATEYCTSGTNPSPVITGAAGVFSSTTGLEIDASTGEIDLAISDAGTYTVTNTIAASGSCPVAIETFDIEIVQAEDASFTYVETEYCATGTVSPVITGAAGVFSSTTGLEIDASTGEIDLSSSDAGTYTVTNTIAATGSCPAAVETFDIEITEEGDASFSYAATTYCATGTVSPVITGAAGVFSSTTGLEIDASTGEIDLAISDAGTYTVTNTIAASGSCPAAVETFDVTVEENPTATLSLTGNTLSVAETGTYQWINCADNSPIAGETAQTYTPSVNGLYAVIVTVGSCSTTSACEVAGGLGVDQKSIDLLSVYPNPTDNTITVGGLTSSNAVVSVLDVNGRVLITEKTYSSKLELSVRDFEAGVYFIKVESETMSGTKKFVKK